MIFIFLLWIIYIETVLGHGKLWEPPSRSTMWRRGFKTPVNPNDNELNCGGYQNHWIKYSGRCGVCGDPYQQHPRQNEAGGKYATEIISRHYMSGQIIDLAVDITANHVGYFEFRICPSDDFQNPVTQKCLDKHPIFIVGSKDGRYHVGGHQNGLVFLKGRLPKGLTCARCVVQWRYRTGNRWGCNTRSGKCGKGYGPQEEFYGCSDVSISSVSPKMTERKPVKMNHLGTLKSNVKLVTNPSDLVDLVVKKSEGSPVLDKLTNILWTLLQTIVSTNRGSRVALVEWNPIGHDIVELGKRSQTPIIQIPNSKIPNVPSNHWPPSKPTVVVADLGQEERGPMMLSELVVDDQWRTPVIRKFKGSLTNIVSETKCYATKEFEKVQGTNEWCGINCNAGNCPPIMCTCTKHVNNAVHLHSKAKTSTIKENNNYQNHLEPRKRTKSHSNMIDLNKYIIPQKRIVKHANANERTIATMYQRCKGAGKFADRPKMIGWCEENCSKGFCPKSICICSKHY